MSKACKQRTANQLAVAMVSACVLSAVAVQAEDGVKVKQDKSQTDTSGKSGDKSNEKESQKLTLNPIAVTASADASAEGLSKPYAGGQVATASRVGFLGNVDNMDSPFSSTSYTNKTIQDKHARSVGDVLQNDPTVRMARGYGNYQESYFIRGFTLSSDEVAYNGLYGLLPRQYVSAELFERVEVLRGANTFLNGAAPGGGAIGGSINLLPKRAPDKPLNLLTAGYMGGDQGYFATDIARRFGPDDNLGIRLNALYNAGNTAVDKENKELGLLSLGLDWYSEKVRISADVAHQQHNLKGGRPNVTLSSLLRSVPAATGTTTNYAQPWSYSNERDTFGALRAEVDILPKLTSWIAFGARNSFESNSLANVTVSNAQSGAATTYRADNRREDMVLSGEVGLRGKLETGPIKQTLAASASTYRLDSKNAYAWSNYNSPLATNIYNPVSVSMPNANYLVGGNLSSPGLTRRDHFNSVAFSDTIALLNDRILVTLGVRNQNIHTRSYNYNTGIQSSEYDKSSWTPAAGIVIKPIKQVSLYANYIESLSPGAAAGSTAVNKGTVLAPYVSQQVEVGAKFDMKTFGGGLSFFTTDKQSGYQDPVTNVFGAYGKDIHQGIELTFFGEPLQGLRMLGGMKFIDATQTNTKGGATDGKKVIGVPSAQGNLGVEWDLPMLAGFTADARMVATGESYADAANTQKVPGWIRYDLGARHTTKIGNYKVTYRARIDNLLNNGYWASVGGYPGYGYLVMSSPRTFSFTASVDF